MKAVGSYILIREPYEEKKSKSGLILTGSEGSEMRYGKGVVLTVGDKVVAVKEGDEIYFDKRQGHQVRLEGELVGVIREGDVVVIL
jgi:co-chaperonin GroES (HSP10)